MKTVKIIFFTALSCMMLTGCNCKYPEIFIYIRSLTFPEIVQDNRLSIVEGNMSDLAVTVHPWNSTIQDIEYTSSDENVLTVGQTGVVTAVAVGTAEVTATAQDEHRVNVKCTVTVTQNVIPVQEILFPGLTNDRLIHPVGFILNIAHLNIDVLPEVATNKTFTLSVGDENIAGIENDNLIFRNIGETTLTATANDGSNVSKTITLEVVEP